VVESVTVVEGSLAYCGVLHVLQCSSGRLFWLPWLQSGHMTIRLYTSHMHIHACTNLGHEHTQIHTYSEFQFHSNLSVSCSVQVRIYICICNSVYKCMQRGDSNTAEIHRIHTCAATKCVEGRAWHLLCTQALPCLTFHCHTVEMGDKVTHTHSHTDGHTHSHSWPHTHMHHR